MKKTLMVTAAVLLAQILSAATYYVSTSGNDSNSGTGTNAAFLTISKAASIMNAGDTCYILSGTYRETVTPAHSGTSSAPITFAAYPGAIPIVSGADVLTLSWGVYSNSIYQASTGSSFNQLFVDGVMMNEARWPNAAVNQLLYAPRSAPQHVTVTPYQGSNSLTDTSLPSGLNLTGAYMHFFPDEYGNGGYEALTRQITGWNPSTKTFSWSGGSVSNGTSFYQTGSLYYVYGALSLLDIPTEWYLNTTSGTLYLWTPDGASPAAHVVEVKDRTSAFTLDNLSYVIVNGIYVFGAGISMANTTRCVVNNCNLIYVQHNTSADWAASVPIANQVSGSGSTWENSTITYSSQDGIRCTGQNEVVSNCVIQQIDYYPGTYYAGVTTFSGASGTKIIDNTIWYSGRYCVGSSSMGDDIASNDLGFGTLLTSDGGATYEYADGGGGGTKIHHNWVHNSWAGVYVDQNQNNYFIYRNVCWSNYNGICCNMFTNNVFINNTSVSNTTDLLFNGSSDVAVTNVNNLWNSFSGAYGSGVTLESNGWYPPLGTNFVPLPGSGAIDHGVVYPPYTDGYVGAAPDIGAYEVGGAYWTPGANFTPQQFPNSNSPPYITTQPANQTNVVGQTATFSVIANSVLPLYYQWQTGTTNSGGPYTNLIAGGQFSGVASATLTISNLVASNAAAYVVVVSNANKSVTSAAATLTVLRDAPSITTQPASQTNVVGRTATFSVTAIGLAPLSYQWRAGASGSGVHTNLTAGGQFSGVTNATLTITNVALGNAADYVVLVTNSSGSITSGVATLTVLTVPPYQDIILADSPVSYWPMQETTGPTIYDIVSGYNGTLMTSTDGTSLGTNQHNAFANAGTGSTDGATYLLGGPGGLPGAPGDTAIYFTNLNTSVNNSQIVVPYISALDPESAFTAEAWIHVPAYPIGYTKSAFQTVLGLEAYGGAQNGWWMAFDTDSSGTEGNVQFNVADDGGGAWLSPAPASTSSLAGQWVYVAEVYNGSNTNLLTYTNGVLMETVAMGTSYESEGLYNIHKLPFVIGSFSSPGGSSGGYNGGGTLADGYERGNFWHGGVSHVAIYDYALTTNQILNHYQAGSTPVPAAPPMISIQPSGSNVMVIWTSGFLQKASAVAGPWTDVTNAVSPYSVGATNAATFYRATLLPPP